MRETIKTMTYLGLLTGLGVVAVGVSYSAASDTRPLPQVQSTVIGMAPPAGINTSPVALPGALPEVGIGSAAAPTVVEGPLDRLRCRCEKCPDQPDRKPIIPRPKDWSIFAWFTDLYNGIRYMLFAGVAVIVFLFGFIVAARIYRH